MNDNKLVLMSVSMVFKKHQGKVLWFLVKENPEDEWNFPKDKVRRGESSVKASVRAMAEKAGINIKTLEEVSRSGGAIMVNGQALPQRIIYYLASAEFIGEVLEYADTCWVEHSHIARKIKSKRELTAVQEAKRVLREVERKVRLNIPRVALTRAL